MPAFCDKQTNTLMATITSLSMMPFEVPRQIEWYCLLLEHLNEFATLRMVFRRGQPACRMCNPANAEIASTTFHSILANRFVGTTTLETWSSHKRLQRSSAIRKYLDLPLFVDHLCGCEPSAGTASPNSPFAAQMAPEYSPDVVTLLTLP